ncbi:hypothetical protein LX36DRAFT_711407 [Colletotrichum falcatum]|nr:hypothetical protein LX36DRAFT_711407 [Colletotrichum falcatum]
MEEDLFSVFPFGGTFIAELNVAREDYIVEDSASEDSAGEDYAGEDLDDENSAGEDSASEDVDDEDLPGEDSNGEGFAGADDHDDEHDLRHESLTYINHDNPEDEAMSREHDGWEKKVTGIIRQSDLYVGCFDEERELKGMYWFPVHIASRSGNLPALEMLVEFGALLNVSSKGLCCENPEMAIYWKWRGFTDKHPAWSPFHVALCHGHEELARYMLKVCPRIQEHFPGSDQLPGSTLPVFISAIRHGLFDLAEFSLELGIDDARVGNPEFFGATLLWRALWETKNFREALAMLLRHGADIDADLGQGHTLLA